jgi:hypothetical protein
MVAAGKYFEHLWRYAVNQAMLPVDAAGPEACQITFQGFGLAGAFKRMTEAFLDQRIDLAKCRFVGFLPILELFPRSWLEDEVHSFAIASSSAIVLVIIFAGSVSAIALRSIALLAGEDIRWVVSSMLAQSSKLTITTGLPLARWTMTGS